MKSMQRTVVAARTPEFSKVRETFEELRFVAEHPTDSSILAILLAHSININAGLVCVGRLEDDPEAECLLPQNWQTPIEGVYSLKYQLKSEPNVHVFFKFIVEENVCIDFNAVTTRDPGRIFSLTQDFSSLKELTTNFNSQAYETFLTHYRPKILDNIAGVTAQAPEPTLRNNIEPDPDSLFWGRPARNPEPAPFPFQPSNPDNNPLRVGGSDLRPIPLNPFGFNSGGGNTGNLMGPRSDLFTGGIGIGGNASGNPANPFGPGRIRIDPFGPDGINGSFPDNNDIEPRPVPRRDPFPGMGRGGPNPFGGGNGYGGFFQRSH
eukprot:TRINITY_DN7992_c0_g1_i9.p1 TRINITY_DN7992_c0_g1~~TRINITY_DN7992_c0_g1_i9.p1  ORF type:complete len:321 (-),score=45.92 TRINITY_DN7992_c0_g1_i9:333-1295(-)